MKKPTLTAVVTAALLCATALLAYEAGGFAYTKRVETKLLAEPKPLAETSGALPLGRQVTIEEVKGVWLRVSDGTDSGWVFSGNLSATKPDEGKGLDAVPLLASKTTATAAARPLTPAGADYASRHNLGSAQEDLDWLLTESALVTAEDVAVYLQDNKRGEFQ